MNEWRVVHGLWVVRPCHRSMLRRGNSWGVVEHVSLQICLHSHNTLQSWDHVWIMIWHHTWIISPHHLIHNSRDYTHNRQTRGTILILMTHGLPLQMTWTAHSDLTCKSLVRWSIMLRDVLCTAKLKCFATSRWKIAYRNISPLCNHSPSCRKPDREVKLQS